MMKRLISMMLALCLIPVGTALAEGEPENKTTEPATVTAQAKGELPSLYETYADKFDFGTAAPQYAFINPKMTEFILKQFNILTPENELKPDSVLNVNGSRRRVKETGDETQVAVHLMAARPLLDFAKKNGLKVHGHVLVWHSQTPEEFFHEGYDTKNPTVSREVMLGRLENYIRDVFEMTESNYPGLIVSWDVLNEAIDDGSSKLRNSNWLKIIGEDFPNRAFEYARKYAPENVKLYYNDYNTAVSIKRAGIEKLLKSLIADGTIDGYGFQMHHKVGSPDMIQIKVAVERIAALGLRLRVSELDIGTSGNSETAFREQADMYANVMKLILSHSEQFDAVQVWGLNDQMSWRSKDYPLLFDAQFEPKPAFWAVIDPYSWGK